MNEYIVTIRETRERKIKVSANSWAEATSPVSDRWDNGEIVLGTDDFTKVEFLAEVVE
ncbi:DpnD/PcfM family protein [Anaerotruncus colihominis]|uniref:DpnD/PcfM-like C-terminal domain-containing protein n=2 Tax=Anaerotruncus colihominis TaxID=169435 RepID=B0PE77_9FIRM|nr:DpnD/PcfM family protein [Anaerotruncus colihominis]EDS10266.1 hypothetical protein ANACOL_02866 [Anaerotruncus colihominis DSM 17241]OUP64234.1 hypothetical protein B5F11_20250 [Anaerotruncus colihominis]OUP69004.1 hypothetical protein B5F10_20155 [Anaerotruncus colihominis]UWN76364.1 DpnD/PcfM family protein [Anaerotruncus colihominis]